jgi:hypothetical protein
VSKHAAQTASPGRFDETQDVRHATDGADV